MINVQTRSPWAVGAAAPDEQAVFPLLWRQCASCHVCLSTSATLCSVDRVPARISGTPSFSVFGYLLRMRGGPFTRPKLQRFWVRTIASNVSGTRARLALWTSGVSFSFMLTDTELDTWAHELRRLSAWFSWISVGFCPSHALRATTRLANTRKMIRFVYVPARPKLYSRTPESHRTLTFWPHGPPRPPTFVAARIAQSVFVARVSNMTTTSKLQSGTIKTHSITVNTIDTGCAVELPFVN